MGVPDDLTGSVRYPRSANDVLIILAGCGLPTATLQQGALHALCKPTAPCGSTHGARPDMTRHDMERPVSEQPMKNPVK